MREKIFFNLLIVIFCLSLIFSVASITKAKLIECADPPCDAPDPFIPSDPDPDPDPNPASDPEASPSGSGFTVTIQNPLTEGTQFEDIVDNLVDFVFNIAIVLAPLTIIAAGFLFATAGGNLEQINRAKAMIVWSIVGFLIILLAKGIMAVIENLLGVS